MSPTRRNKTNTDTPGDGNTAGERIASMPHLASDAPTNGRAMHTDNSGTSAGDVQRHSPASFDGDSGEARIRERAYQLYCMRESADGSDLEDWLEAERQVRFGHAPTEGHGPSVLETLNETQPPEARA